MKVFVTGGGGFLGQSLVRELLAQGFDVDAPSRTECDLTMPISEQNVTYDCIFHLAAWTQAGDFCLRYPGDQWLYNQKINTHVLDWWCTRQPQAKLVFMGTSCVYSPTSSLTEKEFLVGEPIESLYTYAMTKRMLFQGASALSQQYGLNYLCAVPSTLYGPGYHTDGRQMHFIFDLIRKIIRGREFGEQVTLWGDGNQKREIVYVHDFVRILLDLNATFNNEIFNIGAGEEFSIRHFAQLICDYVGYDFDKISFDIQKYVGAKSKCLSVDKVRSSTHQYDLTSLDDGLRKTIDWFYDVGAFNN